MGRYVKVCGICDGEYDEETKKPLVLRCGHSFCSECLGHMAENRRILHCPVCRKTTGFSTVTKIPVCYQLLPHESSGLATLCKEHKSQVLFWCNSCNEKLCRKCLSQKHRDCKWCLFEEQLEAMRKQYSSASSTLKDTFNAHRNKLKTAACQNKALLDFTSHLIDALKTVQIEVAAHQQQLLLLRTKIRKGFESLHKMNKVWYVSPGSDFLTLLQEKNEALAELEKTTGWPQDPNCDILKRIVAGYMVSNLHKINCFLKNFIY